MQNEYLVESVLPSREIHLIAGPSGAGKTRFIFNFLRAWSRGEPIFGYASNPVPFLYISLDRFEESILRTLTSMNIPPTAIPRFTPLDDPLLESINQICCKAKEEYPDAKLYVIEGLAGKVPQHKVSDYGIVSQFLISLGRWCKSEDITIIGVVHATKTKASEKYENPRQRILGSVAWAAFSETIIGIEPSEASRPDCEKRRVYLLPRNTKERMIDMEFRDGILIPVQAETIVNGIRQTKGRPPDKIEEAIADILYTFKLQHMDEFKMGELQKLLSHIRPRTLERAIPHLVNVGQVRPIRHGVYKVISPFNDPLCPDWENLPPSLERDARDASDSDEEGLGLPG